MAVNRTQIACMKHHYIVATILQIFIHSIVLCLPFGAIFSSVFFFICELMFLLAHIAFYGERNSFACNRVQCTGEEWNKINLYYICFFARQMYSFQQLN